MERSALHRKLKDGIKGIIKMNIICGAGKVGFQLAQLSHKVTQ